MTDTVKRYDPELGWHPYESPYAFMDEDPDGDYVQYNDHAKLEANFKALQDELAEIKSRRKMIDWQPIETAPKDGVDILGWREDCGILIIRWTAPAYFCTDEEMIGLDEESATAEGWFCAGFVAGERLEGVEIPSFWRPLPEPPKEEV